MAKDLDNGGFWLPSEFLADDFFMEKESRVCFPSELPYGFDSPVDSAETESDEEDYMAGLTRQMAHSTLQDQDIITAPAFGKKGVSAGSPQSTLCPVGSWSGCSLGSSHGSSNSPSQVSSPPSTPMCQKDEDAWELLCAAAGQVVRMKNNNEEALEWKFHGRGLLGPPRKLSTAEPISVKPPSLGFYPNQALTHHPFQNFQQLKQQQMMKQQQFNVGGFGQGRSRHPLGLSSSAWLPLQQQQQQQRPSSGMRAVFLGPSGSRRESSGTGVFIPRRAGNTTIETRTKPACSTALLPARVVQALNLNINEMGMAQPRFQGSFIHNHDARSSTHQSQQKKPHISPTNHEIRLPKEWTY